MNKIKYQFQIVRNLLKTKRIYKQNTLVTFHLFYLPLYDDDIE